MTAELVKLLSVTDVPTAAAAALALGTPGNQEAVEPLSKALSSDERRISMASIRALGTIGTSEARDALASAASSHPDPSVRKRAAAEVRRLASREH